MKFAVKIRRKIIFLNFSWDWGLLFLEEFLRRFMENVICSAERNRLREKAQRNRREAANGTLPDSVCKHPIHYLQNVEFPNSVKVIFDIF